MKSDPQMIRTSELADFKINILSTIQNTKKICVINEQVLTKNNNEIEDKDLKSTISEIKNELDGLCNWETT